MTVETHDFVHLEIPLGAISPPAPMTRNEKIRSLMYAGNTMQNIGNMFGISRERVRQIVGPDLPRLNERKEAALQEAYADMLAKGEHLSARELSRRAGYRSPQTKKLEALGWTPPRRREPEHGTLTRYTGWGCRCDACRDARRVGRARWLEKVKGNPPVHGTYNAFTNYACRCEPCVEANRAYQRDYNRRRKVYMEERRKSLAEPE